jgi:hypothetical protein
MKVGGKRRLYIPGSVHIFSMPLYNPKKYTNLTLVLYKTVNHPLHKFLANKYIYYCLKLTGHIGRQFYTTCLYLVQMAFPKGLTSAPGRPRVAPNSPVVFDVSLLYIPGLDDE